MKKFWKALAAIGVSAALCAPLAACGDGSTVTDQERLYESYVLYAQAAGDEVLSYQEWLNSVRGPQGEAGEDGKSAYEIAVENGFEGTEEEWLASLKGQDGEDGKDGAAGEKGDKGDKGDAGEKGDKGDPGEQGEQGEKGDKGDPGEKGEQGEKGDQGDAGVGIEDITYSYGYNAEAGYFYTEITFILTNEQEKTVIVPSAMNPEATYVATTAAELKGLLEDGAAKVALGADIEVGTAGDTSTGLTVTNGTITIDLNGYEISNVGTQFALVVNGANAKLTLIDSSEEQTGGIYGGKGGSNQTVRVTGGAQVDIYGGNYSVGPDASNEGNSCIEVAGLGGLVNIYGGVFSSEAAYHDFYYVLNTTQTQGTQGAIYVYGGMFVNFDPSKGDDSSTSNGGSTVNVQSTYVAEGYGVTTSVQDGETVYTVLKISENLGETFLVNNAAEVTSLMNAGVKSISLGADIEMNLVIAEGQELALDLNGHTLTNAGDHTIYNSGMLTVADSVGSGVVDNVTNGRGALVNYGTAILNGGTFTRSKETGKVSAGQNSWYAVLNQGTMTINDGVTVYTEENVSNYSSLIVNGLEGNKTYPLPSGKDSAFMTVNGGTFTGGVATLKNDYYGVLTVVGGTFSGAGSDMSVQNWGVMTVSEGELSSPVFEQEIGAYTQGEDYTKGTTTVSGGTFLGGLGGYEYVDGANDTPVFDKNNIAVSGGTFAEALNEAFVAEGYEAVEQDGVWVVTPKQA